MAKVLAPHKIERNSPPHKNTSKIIEFSFFDATPN